MLYYYPSHREKVEQVRFLAELKGESVFADIHPYAHRIRVESEPEGQLGFPEPILHLQKTDATLISDRISGQEGKGNHIVKRVTICPYHAGLSVPPASHLDA